MQEARHVPPAPSLFSVLRALDASEATTVDALAARLGMRVDEVEVALAAVKAHGVALIFDEVAGVRLASPFDALVVETVARAMVPAARNAVDLHVVDATGSTNSDLRDCAASLPSGYVLAAELQYAGRGRRGRDWTAPLGGSLAFSLLWKFAGGAASLSGLSLTVGLGLARALERCGAAGVMLKWPNDLLVREGEGWAKLCGILIEIAGTGSGPAHAVIGIGINVRLGDANARIDQAATDLAALGVVLPRNAVLAAILEELLATLRAFERDGFAPMVEEWNARHAFQGRRVVAIAGGASDIDGTALGVEGDGALLIATAAGNRRIVSGEVSLRLAPNRETT